MSVLSTLKMSDIGRFDIASGFQAVNVVTEYSSKLGLSFGSGDQLLNMADNISGLLSNKINAITSRRVTRRNWRTEIGIVG